jgi:hypothetical protein
MQSTFEILDGTYKQVGDYLLPDVDVPESPEVGIWGFQRRSICWNTSLPYILPCLLAEGWPTTYRRSTDLQPRCLTSWLIS